MAKAYRPPKYSAPIGDAGTPTHAGLWITFAIEADFDPSFLPRVDARTTQLRRHVRRRYELEVFEFGRKAPRFAVNEQLIFFAHDQAGIVVYGKARIIDVKRWSNRRGRQRAYVWLEYGNSAVMDPKQFIAQATSLGRPG